MKIEAPAMKALSLFPVLKPRVNTKLKLRYFNWFRELIEIFDY
jgi:hypothetical protein